MLVDFIKQVNDSKNLQNFESKSKYKLSLTDGAKNLYVTQLVFESRRSEKFEWSFIRNKSIQISVSINFHVTYHLNCQLLIIAFNQIKDLKKTKPKTYINILVSNS